jgi:hypothetical protein
MPCYSWGMKTMQHLISTVDDVGDVRQFQAYFCAECDEVRWCQPGQPECYTDEGQDKDHPILPVWVQR